MDVFKQQITEVQSERLSDTIASVSGNLQLFPYPRQVDKMPLHVVGAVAVNQKLLTVKQTFLKTEMPSIQSSTTKQTSVVNSEHVLKLDVG